MTVNTRRQLRTQDLYVLMSQACQVFHVRDGHDPNKVVAVKTQLRHHYDVPEKETFEEDAL